ncbi:MAG: MarR family winged helix-turn-helix transcriptional regulator [Bacillota bacterium]
MEVIKIQENGGKSDGYLSKLTLYELTSFHDAMEDAFDVHFARYGLSGPKFKVLINLYMAGDRGLIQSELGTKMQVSRANITGLVERLEKEGLVVRNNDPSDKRVFRVCLTNRAFALMHVFLPVHNDFMNKIVSALDRNEKEVLISLLKKLNKGLDSI